MLFNSQLSGVGGQWELWYVAFATFHVVDTPIMVDLKLPRHEEMHNQLLQAGTSQFQYTARIAMNISKDK